jgi:SpoVK/Ycf46/Vps4 family AAA+-type ATPase
MTTNAPKSLDQALCRPGRMDKRFLIGYATKTTAELTFLRMFGTDKAKRFTDAAVRRFAEAFKQQFPQNSSIATANLAHYCSVYRGRPDKAVLEFAAWLAKTKSGFDAFEYDINDDAEGLGVDCDVALPYDHGLLEVRPEDFVERNDNAAPAEIKLAEPVARSRWGFLGRGAAGVKKQLEAFGEATTLPMTVEEEFAALKCAESPPVECTKPGIKLFDLDSQDESSGFPDIEFGMHDSPSPPMPRRDSAESEWDEEHSNRATPWRSRVSVKFSDPGKLSPASPRPIE